LELRLVWGSRLAAADLRPGRRRCCLLGARRRSGSWNRCSCSPTTWPSG
jgi:hypothetical protein